MSSPEVDVAAYHEDGFLVVPGVFSTSEIAEFRGGGPGHLSATPLKNLWRDPRLISIAADLLGTAPTFFASAHYVRSVIDQNFRPSAHLHHDAKGTLENLFNRVHPPQEKTYPVVRFGIYLQDHSAISGGLKVSPGSHLLDSADFLQADMPVRDLSPAIGDLVCFCARTLHAGCALRLKADPHRAISTTEEMYLYPEAPEDFLPLPPQRDVIFIDYARNSEAADLLIKSRAAFPGDDNAGAELFEPCDGPQLRLDFCVIEVAKRLADAIRSKHIGTEQMALLRRLPHLCRLSKETSPHYSLIPEPTDDSVEGALALVKEIFGRLSAVQATYSLARRDEHMSQILAQA